MSCQDQNISQNYDSTPRFLQVSKRDESLSTGKLSEIDMLIIQGKTDLNALNTVRGRPSHKNKTFKKVSRAIDEAEEYVQFVQRKLGDPKGSLGDTK